MNKEQILEELKDLDLSKEDIKNFFDKRVSFMLEVKPCKKKTRYTVSTFINIASDYEEKDLVEDISDLIGKSEELNYTFLTSKTDKDIKKRVWFFCDFLFDTGLSSFDKEINQNDFITIQNVCLKACKLLKFLEDNLEENTTNYDNVIYLNRR